jgi:hypothetical protein
MKWDLFLRHLIVISSSSIGYRSLFGVKKFSTVADDFDWNFHSFDRLLLIANKSVQRTTYLPPGSTIGMSC